MEEELTEYIKVIKNDPQTRDRQVMEYISEIKTIHDSFFENGINQYNIDCKTMLLSYCERLSYYDKSRTSFDTYLRYADFIQTKAKREIDYQASADKDSEEMSKTGKGIINILTGVSNSIPSPEFRVYLVLLGVAVFKDEGSITKKQREFLEEVFKSLQIAG